jgi:hypothetical protein
VETGWDDTGRRIRENIELLVVNHASRFGLCRYPSRRFDSRRLHHGRPFLTASRRFVGSVASPWPRLRPSPRAPSSRTSAARSQAQGPRRLDAISRPCAHHHLAGTLRTWRAPPRRQTSSHWTVASSRLDARDGERLHAGPEAQGMADGRVRRRHRDRRLGGRALLGGRQREARREGAAPAGPDGAPGSTEEITYTNIANGAEIPSGRGVLDVSAPGDAIVLVDGIDRGRGAATLAENVQVPSGSGESAGSGGGSVHLFLAKHRIRHRHGRDGLCGVTQSPPVHAIHVGRARGRGPRGDCAWAYASTASSYAAPLPCCVEDELDARVVALADRQAGRHPAFEPTGEDGDVPIAHGLQCQSCE